MNPSFEDLLTRCRVRVVPVITLHDVDDAVPLAEALVAGGLSLLEVTLRTPAALAAIESIAAAVPDAVVGAGTVTTATQLRDARSAGAQFIVSPGCTDALIETAAREGGAFLPGAVTASEILRLIEADITVAKFFPAEASGGIAMLRALAAPFPGMRFCPTGGIGPSLAPHYLSLANVACVGGSWMLAPEALAAKDWDRIRSDAAHVHEAKGPPH